jgi:hypothetical protein
LDKEIASDPKIKKSLNVVEDFIKTHRVMCYGGTAINNLLPKKDQFYKTDKDIPDYDFFSETPQIHAISIADKLASQGYKNIEVKPGMHLGTFKVFADFLGIADISHLEKPIFSKLWENSIEKDGIHYVPPNFLRMSMYLELSRPRGDVSRWKKVYNRLNLLNKHYPMKCPDFKQENDKLGLKEETKSKIEKYISEENLVLLGINASFLQKDSSNRSWELPLDLLVSPEKRTDVSHKLKNIFDEDVSIKKADHPAYGELLPAHTDLNDSKTGRTLVRIYETEACHSYHETSSGLKVASIPTLLQFFLAIPYASKHFLEDLPEERYLCVAQNLIDIADSESKRRFKLLTPISCLGKQKSLVDMKSEKSELYERLSRNKSSAAFLEYFFSYSPTSMDKTKRNQLKHALRKTIKHHRP